MNTILFIVFIVNIGISLCQPGHIYEKGLCFGTYDPRQGTTTFSTIMSNIPEEAVEYKVITYNNNTWHFESKTLINNKNEMQIPNWYQITGKHPFKYFIQLLKKDGSQCDMLPVAILEPLSKTTDCTNVEVNCKHVCSKTITLDIRLKMENNTFQYICSRSGPEINYTTTRWYSDDESKEISAEREFQHSTPVSNVYCIEEYYSDGYNNDNKRVLSAYSPKFNYYTKFSDYKVEISPPNASIEFEPDTPTQLICKSKDVVSNTRLRWFKRCIIRNVRAEPLTEEHWGISNVALNRTFTATDDDCELYCSMVAKQNMTKKLVHSSGEIKLKLKNKDNTTNSKKEMDEISRRNIVFIVSGIVASIVIGITSFLVFRRGCLRKAKIDTDSFQTKPSEVTYATLEFDQSSRSGLSIKLGKPETQYAEIVGVVDRY